MKTSFRILFSICSVLLLLGCKEEDEWTGKNPTLVPDQILTFDLTKIYAPSLGKGNQVLDGYFFDTIPVTLGRLGEDSLIFIMPPLPTNHSELKVVINGKQRVWKFQNDFAYKSTPKWDPFFESIINNNEALLSEMKEVESLDGFTKDYQKLISQLKMEYSQLSDSEKEIFIGVLAKPFMEFWHYFLKDPPLQLKIPDCKDFPLFGFFGFLFGRDHLNYLILAQYAELPDSKLYRTLKTGLGLAIWYQNGLLEASAAKILTCPILRNFVFKKPGDQLGSLITQPTLILESGVPNEVYVFANFQKPSKVAISDYEINFVANTEWFRGFKKNTFRVLDMLRKDSSVPIMTDDLLFTIPERAPIEEMPLPSYFDFQIQVPFQPNIRIVDFVFVEGKMSVLLESLTGNEYDFDIWINYLIRPQYLTNVVSAKLKVSCSLLARIILVEEKAQLNIQFGEPPYHISWSNGLDGVGPFDLVSGRYSIQVVDSGGCERLMEFEMPEFSSVSDIDGNVYRTVKIGLQWWMAENLRTTKKNDGTEIKQVRSSSETAANSSLSLYAVIDNKPENDKKYGKLYNENAACCNTCPKGWHLPTLEEWRQLFNYLGPKEATNMKTFEGWKTSLVKGTNISGFSAHSAGYFDWTGYVEEDLVTDFWVYRPITEYHRLLIHMDLYEFTSVRPAHSSMLYSVRCLKD